MLMFIAWTFAIAGIIHLVATLATESNLKTTIANLCLALALVAIGIGAQELDNRDCVCAESEPTNDR